MEKKDQGICTAGQWEARPLPSPCACQGDLCWRIPGGEMGCELWVWGKKNILGHGTDPKGLGTSLPRWCHLGDVFKVFWGSFVGFWPVSLSFSMASVPAWAVRSSSFSLCSWGGLTTLQTPPKFILQGFSSQRARRWLFRRWFRVLRDRQGHVLAVPSVGSWVPTEHPCPSCTLTLLSPSMKLCQDVTSVPQSRGTGGGRSPWVSGTLWGSPGAPSTATGGC